ncbi:MAG TPA: hypothetical protein VM618_06940 [Acidimicrobiia bacterium]|nr:hypothetical protein [Acidimicrobiia bacterium]
MTAVRDADGARDDVRSVSNLPVLAFVLTGGMAAWAVHVTVGLALVGYACSHDATWILHALSVVTAVGAAAAVWIGLGVLRAAHGSDAREWTVHGREAFMALVGVILSGLGLWLILFEWIPVFVVGPCR